MYNVKQELSARNSGDRILISRGGKSNSRAVKILERFAAGDGYKASEIGLGLSAGEMALGGNVAGSFDLPEDLVARVLPELLAIRGALGEELNQQILSIKAVALSA